PQAVRPALRAGRQPDLRPAGRAPAGPRATRREPLPRAAARRRALPRRRAGGPMSAAPVPDGTLGLVDPPIAVTGGAEHAAVARLALRRLTSGVTVLTVNDDGHRHGTTVSAAVTISR